MAKRGRPTDYRPEFVDQVERFCRVMGSLDTDIAQFFSVHIDTVYEWKNAHPEFSEAIKRGKAVCDREVGEKLIERAMGAKFYQDKEIKLKTVEYENGKKCHEEERFEIVRLEGQAPPDTQALIFFLKNRRPDLFRDKQEVEHSANKDAPPVFTLKIDNS